MPLTAAQILWLNLITDGFLDMALAQEEPDRIELMSSSWLKNAPGLIDWRLIVQSIFMAVVMAAGSIGVFLQYQSSAAQARTMALVTLAMFQWFNAWNCRSETKSLFALQFMGNFWLLVATFVVIVLQLLIFVCTPLQTLFSVTSLTWYHGSMRACGFNNCTSEELRKLLFV